MVKYHGNGEDPQTPCNKTSERKPSSKAIGLCAKWLQQCLRLGWPKSALDELEKLWWQYHDNYGRLVK